MAYKILYIKLVNHIGIWEGTGQRELEIDFSKGKNRIVVLAGKNGSGKTTLLSCLHPMAGNGDTRKSIILPNHEGLKEIHITDGENVYEITHHYTDSVKSYIKKNGTELNPNGGVRTFESIVETELQFDKSYFRIGRVGDNNQNFIDMTATERKKFIFENFLPNVDEYLHYFKIVKEKFNKLSSDIKFLVDELAKIEDPDTLYIRIEKDAKDIEQLESQLEKAKIKLGVINSRVDEKLKSLGLKDISMIDRHLRNIAVQIENLEGNLEVFNENYRIATEKIGTDIDGYYLITKEKALKLGNEIQLIKDKIKESYRQSVRLSNSINEEESRLKGLEVAKTDRDELETQILELSKELQKNTSVLEDVYPEHFNMLTNNEVDIDDIFNYRNFINTLVTHLKEIAGTIAIKTQYIEMSKDESYRTKKSFLNLLSETSNKVIECEDKVASLTNKINIIQNDASRIDVLKLRPEDCTIDSCGFIKDALAAKQRMEKEYPQLQKELNEQEALLIKLKKEEKLMEDYLEDYLDPILNLQKFYQEHRNSLLVKYHFTECIDVDMTNLFELVESLDLNSIQELFSGVAKEIRDTKTTMSNLVSMEEKLSNLEVRLQLINNEEEQVKEISKRIDDLNKQLEVYNEEIEDGTNTISEMEIKLNKINKRINFITDLIEQKNSNLENLEELNKLRDTFNSAIEDKEFFNSKADDITELMDTINELEHKLKILQKSQKDNTVKITRYENYKERKGELDADYEETKLVYEALDPKNGIPVHLIGNYLKDTVKITNDLLDISQKGNFQIDVLVNEKEFKIPVITGDISTHKEDIVLASQGQQALTKVSLSMALVQQRQTGGYNILSLDEMDSTLDSNNAKYYIDMVEHQGNEIGAEQIFVISHTREFESQNIDLILMKDHGIDTSRDSFIEGKTVLFDYYNQK